jgi:hypothetical protein
LVNLFRHISNNRQQLLTGQAGEGIYMPVIQPVRGVSRRFLAALTMLAAVLLALTIANIRYSPWTTSTARSVDQRGPLSDEERATIEIFERVSPSVVQVAAPSAANPLMEEQPRAFSDQVASYPAAAR